MLHGGFKGNAYKPIPTSHYMTGRVGGEGVVLDKRGMLRNHRDRRKVRQGETKGGGSTVTEAGWDEKIDDDGDGSSEGGHRNLRHDLLPPILTLLTLLLVLIARRQQRSKHIPSSQPSPPA